MTVDIACFHWPADKEAAMVQQLADEAGGSTIVGSQKLAQRVLIELLTEEGSQQYSGRGTAFLTRLRNGAYSEMDVLVAFSSVRMQLRMNLQKEESAADDPAERYMDSYIDQIIVGPGAVQLRLNIKSRAVLTTVVMLPIMVFEYH
jgi:hypothetical protein